MIKKYFPFLALVLVIFILRLPSFFEPHWYFDEGVYSLFGRAIVEGEIPYQYIWDHKPLGIYLIYSLAYMVPFDILIGAKILAFLSASASSILLYLIARQGFPKKVALTAAFIFATLSSLPFFDGNQANGEIFLITPVLLGLYLIEPFSKAVNLKKLFFAGIAIGAAISIKQVAAVDLALAVVLLTLKEGRYIKNLAALIAGSVLFPGIIAILTISLGTSVHDLWFSVVQYNLTYVVSRRLGTLFNFLKIIALGFVAFVFVKKPKITYSPIILWFAFDLIGVLTGGQPFPHYLIQILPVSSLILAVAVTRKYATQLITRIGVIIATFFLFMLANSFFRIVPYGDVFKEWDYYPSFMKTVISRDKDAFNSVFSERWGVDRNKKVINFLNEISEPKDQVYIWGGGTTAWLYYDLDRRLPSRYISFIHTDTIPGSEAETINSLEVAKPKFIITTPRETFPELKKLIEESYAKKEVIDDVIIYDLRKK